MVNRESSITKSMCARVAMAGSHGMSKLQVCVDCNVAPSGSLMVMGLVSIRLLRTGAPSAMKWLVAPESLRAVCCSGGAVLGGAIGDTLVPGAVDLATMRSLIAEARASLTQPLIPGVGQTARGEVVAGVPIHSLRLAGVSAKQDVHFGGNSEVLTISHEVSSVASYGQGIQLSLRVAAKSQGLVVGLQSVVDSSASNA